LDNWIYWRIPLQSLLITVNYSRSQSIQECLQSLLDYECLLFHRDWFGFDLRIGHLFSFCYPLVITPQLNTQLNLTTKFWTLLQKNKCRTTNLRLNREWTPNESSQSQRLSHIATDGQSVSKSWCRAPRGAHDQICITLRQLRSCFCGPPSLTRGRVCLLYVLLALDGAVFLGSESLGARDHIFCLRFETFLLVVSYDSRGHGRGIRPRPPTRVVVSWISSSHKAASIV
jgi:hypothetical protein